MPTPAAFPSRLVTSGRRLADANGFILPPLTGINIDISTSGAGGGAPVLQDFLDIKAKGASYVRVEMKWMQAESTPGTITSWWQTDLDNVIINAYTAGLYVWLMWFFQDSSVMPAWANVTADASMQNYVNNNASAPGGGPAGQFWTQAVAYRYGNPASPFLTAHPGCKDAIIGCGINEPNADYTNANNWLTHLISQELQMVSWVRATGYAPNWIVSLQSDGAGGSWTPNATGSGQTTQTYTAPSLTPTTNFMIEQHESSRCACYIKSDSVNWPDFDGRNKTYGGNGNHGVAARNATYPGYVDASTGITLVHSVDPTITRSDLQRGFVALWATYWAYSAAANVPVCLMEANFDPVVCNAGPGGALGDEFITDKLALWGSFDPPVVMRSCWEYNRNQSGDDFAQRPGTGTGVVGADPNGWTHYANKFFSTPPGGVVSNRLLQSAGKWYRRK